MLATLQHFNGVMDLVAAEYPSLAVESFEYDWAGSIRSRTRNGVSTAFCLPAFWNRLGTTCAGGPWPAVSYDLHGNQLRRDKCPP